MKAILFDIDGTLADIEHRVHLLPDWPKFFNEMHNDVGIEPIIDLTQLVYGGTKHFPLVYQTIIVTARPGNYREVTEQWLKKWLIPYDRLYMRKEGDYRPDSIVKAELLEQIIDDGYKPMLVVDDRPEVVDMWRSYGLACLQCASDEIKLKHDGKNFLNLLIGPSGAGKSTAAALFASKHDIVSTDELREQYGWGHTPDDLARTWNYAHALMKARLENHIYTVFDATNIKQGDRLKLLRRPEDLILKHHRTFQRELPNILAGDNLPNVVVVDKRTR
jgi:hypothetical protein